MSEIEHPLMGVSVGFLGAGNMGSCIARSLAREGVAEVFLFDPRAEVARALAEEIGATCVDSEEALVGACEVVVLACKPQVIPGVIQKIAWGEEPRALVSIAAGLRVDVLQSMVPEHISVVRTMPNTPAMVGAGMTGILRHADGLLQGRVEALFEACGDIVVLEKESLFNALTAISGSGPAYLFVAMEALADGGVKMGLPRDLSQKLAMHTVRGAAELAIQTGTHTAALKDQVTSPGGTTIAAIAALEEHGFRNAWIKAIEAATARGEEMGS